MSALSEIQEQARKWMEEYSEPAAPMPERRSGNSTGKAYTDHAELMKTERFKVRLEEVVNSPSKSSGKDMLAIHFVVLGESPLAGERVTAYAVYGDTVGRNIAQSYGQAVYETHGGADLLGAKVALSVLQTPTAIGTVLSAKLGTWKNDDGKLAVKNLRPVKGDV